jgi:hypothetical protein
MRSGMGCVLRGVAAEADRTRPDREVNEDECADALELERLADGRGSCPNSLRGDLVRLRSRSTRRCRKSRKRCRAIRDDARFEGETVDIGFPSLAAS